MAAKWDPKNHVVLATFPEVNYAVLFLSGAKHQQFVAAYGYDPESRSWSQGHYFDNPVDAWNHANPDVVEHLCTTYTYRDVLETMHGAGFTQATEQDAREYTAVCCTYMLLADAADNCSLESDDICEWWGCNRESA